ncbi:hypothetical protein DPMN_162287 [Dreissena polymorpha]|uniref:Uncharacterized protein n=1 Tax=Dreissena polymorpha TaxID=45954 RepID=A0A9D4ES08_DREPO|nr:hypothetical protein DPMN_162287 [Dreissena polymorpha]
MSKFHEDWEKNVSSRLFTQKTAPLPGRHEKDPPGGHVFLPIQTIIELNCPIQVWKNSPPLGSHVFSSQDIIGTNHLSKFHEDRKINEASRVKNAPPPGGHVFQPTNIILELIQDIIGVNLLTKFYEDWTINVASRVKNAPPHGSNVFQSNVTIFELIQDIIETNLLTKFHED